jgi:hypothetical protein
MPGAVAAQVLGSCGMPSENAPAGWTEDAPLIGTGKDFIGKC